MSSLRTLFTHETNSWGYKMASSLRKTPASTTKPPPTHSFTTNTHLWLFGYPDDSPRRSHPKIKIRLNLVCVKSSLAAK